MNQLYTKAIRKAGETRFKLGISLHEPINIYDVCNKLEIDVQFVDINMEGLYVNNALKPKIIISALRPFPRRVFTCGHELGHHLFQHGLKVDILSNENGNCNLKHNDEILVDTFSAHFLMPISCIQSEFKKRKLSFSTAKFTDFYTISSVLGVGYSTLITHCKTNRLLDEWKFSELLKYTPAKIFNLNFGNLDEKTYFKIIDSFYNEKPIDLEVGNYIVFPKELSVDSNFLTQKRETEIGVLYQASKSGITPVNSIINETGFFVRIQPKNYFGFADYRHLES